MTFETDLPASTLPSQFGNVSETVVDYRPEARPRFALLDRMMVSKGSAEDWDLLHHLHYKAEGKPPGPTYWKLTLNDETIGVCILSLPRPLLKERHAMFDWLRPGNDTKLSNTARYHLINGSRRVASRVVVDSMWRGCGASYRFLNISARLSGFFCIEFQSAMSKYNQFADRAGFTFCKPMRSPNYEKGLRAFKSVLASHPADTEAVLAEMEAMKPASRKTVREVLQTFYTKHSSMEQTGDSSNPKRIADRKGAIKAKLDAMSDREFLGNFQQLVLASPLFGIYQNPDFGRTDLPEQVPLRYFDNQPTNQPLIV